MFFPLVACSDREPKTFFVWLTCIYILFWYLQLGNRVGLLQVVRIEFLLGVFLSIFALLNLLESKVHSPLRGPVLFYLGVMGLYVLFSVAPALSWDIFFNRVVKFSMMAAFLAAFIRTPWALKLVVGAFLLSMLKLGQEGFIGWLTGSMVWQNQGIMRLHGSTGLYSHPNSFSGMAVGCLPFIYYLYPVVRRFWRPLLLVLLSFCIVIIIFTGSRTGYLATLGLGFFFLLKSYKHEWLRYLLIAATLCVAIVILTPSDYMERFESILSMEEKEGASAETRLQIIKDAIQVYAHYPLGVGVGAFPIVRHAMFDRSQDTHNLYFELLTNMGPLGLVVFLVFVHRILRVNAEIQRKLNNFQDSDSKFLLATSRSIVAYIYARLFLGMFGMDTYEIYWWFATGLTVALWSICHLSGSSQLISENSSNSIA